MPNLSIAYQRPNHCLRTLTNELARDYGYPARPYEYVTGYKSSANNSGHCPDNNGVVHGVDIFVGPGNLTEAQGITVAEQLRIEGTRGTIPGHPDRLYYIIHRRRIAGDFSNWEWVAYGGLDDHYDHIHVSTADTFWGDPVRLSPLDYDSTAPWNLGHNTVAPQLSTLINLIGRKDFALATVEEVFNYPVARSDGAGNITLTQMLRYYSADIASINAGVGAVKARTDRYLDTKISAVAGKVMEFPVDKVGGPKGAKTTLGGELSYLSANFGTVSTAIGNAVKAVTATVGKAVTK